MDDLVGPGRPPTFFTRASVSDGQRCDSRMQKVIGEGVAQATAQPLRTTAARSGQWDVLAPRVRLRRPEGKFFGWRVAPAPRRHSPQFNTYADENQQFEPE